MAAVSSRYARALADVIADAKLDAAKAVAQLRSLVAAFEESRELREVWESPAVPAEQKRKLLDALAAKPRRRRPSHSQLHRRAHRSGSHRSAGGDCHPAGDSNSTPAADASTPKSSVPASLARAARRLLGEIARLTGKTVLPHYATDEKLIGGVTVRVGSTIYDGSVRGQLQRIRQQLSRELRLCQSWARDRPAASGSPLAGVSLFQDLNI